MHIHKVEFYKKSKARFDEDDEFKDRARKEVLALLCVCVCVCLCVCVSMCTERKRQKKKGREIERLREMLDEPRSEQREGVDLYSRMHLAAHA